MVSDILSYALKLIWTSFGSSESSRNLPWLVDIYNGGKKVWKQKCSVFLNISVDCYVYKNYIFLESTYNTDSHGKISVGGNNFGKKM